ncbi:hypothetical protein [Aliivibrio fischeri]|uniref:hypothetical protein n=1 Tax=Aliivibrio fischeri TaxID=668 RepID=UPI00080E2152|nr:hypothetical protein [Aliivibrio fischeri]OCH12306.1 hypothetical protein A6E09_18900 [Aliivibrio fischeri]
MSFTFRALSKGDNEIVNLYSEANSIWTKELKHYNGDSLLLAKRLGTLQLVFEQLVDENSNYDRWDGQEIMVFSGLTFYSDYEDNRERDLAESVVEAFEMSFCSLEVKGLAKRFSHLLYLGKY